MLETPFGLVRVFINGIETTYTFESLSTTNHSFSEVDGRYQIIINNTETSTIRCIIPTFKETAFPETGERFEAVTFYQNGAKLTLGTVADFEEQSGHLLSNGIEVTTDEPVIFGICWINNVTEENDHQTWFGADLSY